MEEINEPRLELGTVRGIACVALVAYHVIGPTSDSGMHLPNSSYWHVAMNGFDFLRMPMFTVLSGFLYAAHRVDADCLISFFERKAARLLLPLLFLTSVMLLIRQAVYDDNTSYASALLFHYQHLWFLQSLFLIFVGIGVWDAFARPSWVGLVIAGFAAVMISRTFEVTQFLSMNGALYLLPFFALGMILRIEPAILRSSNLTMLAMAIVTIVMLMQQASHVFGGSEIARFSLPAAMCGVAGAYLMLVHCPKIRIFEGVGQYSYTVYLWHSIASSGVRHILVRSAALPNALEFGLLLVAGVAVPIVLHLIVQRIPVLSLVAAGIRPEQRQRTVQERRKQSARCSAALPAAPVAAPLRTSRLLECTALGDDLR